MADARQPQDPQSEPGTFCPRNRFGIRDYTRLSDLEASAAHRRQLELSAGEMRGKFDIGHLRKIHWYLFRDIFPWAGELRQTRMSKPGSAEFAHPQFIQSYLDALFTELKSEQHLRALSREKFAERASYYWGELNAVHPFREGNGRTQREFLRQLAAQAGHHVSWANLQEIENREASIAAHLKRDYTLLEGIMLAAIKEDAKGKAAK